MQEVVRSKIAIVLLTAGTKPERLGYAKATLHSVLSRLRSSECELRLHIGDDGSGCDYQRELVAIADEYGYSDDLVITDSGLTGYGANYNLAMKTVHKWADYILPLEDDWELTRDFDIDCIVHVLRDKVFDSVRMGYIGYTQPLYTEFVYFENEHWLRLLDYSHEPHVFSGHPRLETVEYQKRVGPWPERLSPGETEWYVATQMPEARKGVGYPLWTTCSVKDGLFSHIGTVKSF